MDLLRTSPANTASRGVGGIAILILAAVALYYLYDFLYRDSGLMKGVILQGTVAGNSTPPNIADLYYVNDGTNSGPVAPIMEGGEYSVTLWAYVTAFKDQVGKNKHIFELRGTKDGFSTLAIGLGATTNKLLVRVHTAGQNATTLSSANVTALFSAGTLSSGMTEDTNQMCDLPEVDLQRWVCIGVVLNGRTVDVYLDGKLARSCVLPSIYKVDPSGVAAKLLDFGGFDGFLADVTTYNYAINPDEMYRIYMTGPTETQGVNLMSWFRDLFKIKGTVSYNYPVPAVTFPRASYTF